MMAEQKNPLGPVGHVVRENVKRLREAQRLTYVELADRTAKAGRPIPVLGLRRVEAGERRVDADDLVVLADTLGVRPEQLLAPFECEVCHGKAPAGFECTTCGMRGTQ